MARKDSTVLVLYLLLVVNGLAVKVPCSSEPRCHCKPVIKNKYEAHCTGLGLTTSSFPRFESSVVSVDVSNNNIRELPVPIIRYLPSNLSSFNISRNYIETIKINSFSELPNLRILSLNNNLLKYVFKGSFSSLYSLQFLDLSFNNFLTFRVLPNISYDLQFTDIKTLKLNRIHCLDGMTTIIFASDVQGLTNTSLQKIYLSSNRISLLEQGVMLALPKTVSFVDLSENRLKLGSYMLEMWQMTNLKVLTASRTQHYTELNLENCYDWRGPPSQKKDITHKTYQFSALRRQEVIWKIPPSLKVFSIGGMEFGNGLENLTFNRNNTLEKLELQRNLLETLFGTLKNLHHLKYFDLSYNFCHNISSQFFYDLPKLASLKINNNYLGQILSLTENENIFSRLHSLEFLDLSSNIINSLPINIFHGLSKLQYLNVSSNYLSDWRSSIRHMDDLKFLNLASNRLSAFQKSTMAEIDEILQNSKLKISLKNNVLQCTCDTLNFLKWVLKHSDTFYAFDTYTCVNAKMNVIFFTDLESQIYNLERECANRMTLILGALFAVLFSITVMLGCVIYRYRWRIKYMWYMVKIKITRKPEKPDNHYYDFDAFISYANEDQDFVHNTMYPKLEEDYRLRIQFHGKDFIPGKGIAENIVNAIHTSRKTIIILSTSYLQSGWCMFEYNMARMESIHSRTNEDVVVMVRYKPIRDRDIPLKMMDLMEEDTYMVYPTQENDRVAFWNNLHRAIIS